MAKKKIRGFEKLSNAVDVNLPVRSTKGSAGYDFEASEDIIFGAKETIAVPTGIKAYMLEDEYLGLHVRSSIAFKRGLMLINGEGIIDSDYYNNPDNEGHIMVGLYNTKTTPVVIKKGERIAQGIFYKYLLADEDSANTERTGGIGSTGK